RQFHRWLHSQTRSRLDTTNFFIVKTLMILSTR
ncbi:hypothetical protein, partial [Bacillus phage SPG24]